MKVPGSEGQRDRPGHIAARHEGPLEATRDSPAATPSLIQEPPGLFSQGREGMRAACSGWLAEMAVAAAGTLGQPYVLGRDTSPTQGFHFK